MNCEFGMIYKKGVENENAYLVVPGINYRKDKTLKPLLVRAFISLDFTKPIQGACV